MSPTARLRRLGAQNDVIPLGTVLKNAKQLLLLLVIVRYVALFVEKSDPVWFVTARVALSRDCEHTSVSDQYGSHRCPMNQIPAREYLFNIIFLIEERGRVI